MTSPDAGLARARLVGADPARRCGVSRARRRRADYRRAARRRAYAYDPKPEAGARAHRYPTNAHGWRSQVAWLRRGSASAHELDEVSSKPVIVGAARWDGRNDPLRHLIPKDAYHGPACTFWREGGFTMDTPRGPFRFKVGDWILRTAQGEWKRCSDKVFRQQYEPEDEAPFRISTPSGTNDEEEDTTEVRPGARVLNDDEPLEPIHAPENEDTPDDHHTALCYNTQTFYGYCSCGLTSKRSRLATEKKAAEVTS